MFPVLQIILILISSLHIQKCVQEKLWEISAIGIFFHVINVMYVCIFMF